MVRYLALFAFATATLVSGAGCGSGQKGVKVPSGGQRDIEHTPTEDERVPKLIVTLTESEAKGKRRSAAEAIGRYWEAGKLSEETRATGLEALKAALETEEEEKVLEAIKKSIALLEG